MKLVHGRWIVVNTPTHGKTIAISVASMPNLLLRLEGLAVFIAAVVLYAHQGGNGLAFVALLLATVALIVVSPVGLQLALIWFAHIGLDRAMGFGLKYATVFNDTHFQHI
jgi:hypothetical protein